MSRWRPTFGQFRLAILMFALVLGITGMTQGQPRLVNSAMVIGMIGVVLGLIRRFMDRSSRPAE